MTALEALMAAGLFVAPQGQFHWADPTQCVIPTEQGKTMLCSDFGGFVPNVHDENARAVTTTRELGPMPGMIPGAALILSPDLVRPRNFNDELATIPGAFDGAMREDKPAITDLVKPSTEGTGGR